MARERSLERALLVGAGISGFFAVALGAFGAHGLERRLAGLGDGAQRMEWWATAAHYHLVHSLALGLCAYLVTRTGCIWGRVASGAFAVGIVVFSGSLYVMTLTGARWLGMITPIGGLSLTLGWLAFAIAGSRVR